MLDCVRFCHILGVFFNLRFPQRICKFKEFHMDPTPTWSFNIILKFMTNVKLKNLKDTFLNVQKFLKVKLSVTVL